MYLIYLHCCISQAGCVSNCLGVSRGTEAARYLFYEELHVFATDRIDAVALSFCAKDKSMRAPGQFNLTTCLQHAAL